MSQTGNLSAMMEKKKENKPGLFIFLLKRLMKINHYQIQKLHLNLKVYSSGKVVANHQTMYDKSL